MGTSLTSGTSGTSATNGHQHPLDEPFWFLEPGQGNIGLEEGVVVVLGPGFEAFKGELADFVDVFCVGALRRIFFEKFLNF